VVERTIFIVELFFVVALLFFSFRFYDIDHGVGKEPYSGSGTGALSASINGSSYF